MKWAIWITTGVLMLLWTGGVWATAALTAWLGERVGAGVDWSAVASVNLPAWVGVWFDPGWVSAVIEGLVRAMEGLQLALPWLASAAGWVVAGLWLMWGLGAALLLVLGGGTHWLVARRSARPAAA